MANVKTENVTYSGGGATLKGLLAWDAAASGPRPGVLVAPEWWGVDDYIRGRARQLAELGYVALTADMYGDGRTADNPNDANAMMTAALSDMPALGARFEAARATLAAHPACNGKVAAIGYCFGGAVVLHAARTGMNLAAVASFHGSLGSTHTPKKGGIKAKVLVCHGAADQFVPQADIDGLKKEMAEAGASLRFVAYDGVLHGFSNPAATAKGEKYGLPLKYDADADKRSWAEMKKLFEEVF